MHRWEVTYTQSQLGGTQTTNVVADGPVQALEVARTTIFGRGDKYELVKLERKEYVTLPRPEGEAHG